MRMAQLCSASHAARPMNPTPANGIPPGASTRGSQVSRFSPVGACTATVCAVGSAVGARGSCDPGQSARLIPIVK